MTKEEKQRNRVRRRKQFKRSLPLLFFTLPGLVWLIIFYYIPVFGNIVAFKKFKFSENGGFWDSIFESEWVGFKNFEFLFSSKNAYIITRNTVLYNLFFIFVGLFIAVSFAIILSQMRNRFLVKSIQTSMLLPYFISWVIVSFFVSAFISPENGYISRIVSDMGGTMGNWYTKQAVWPPLLSFLGIWKGIGYSSVIYFAAIVGIDRSYYEAAEVDGATKWQQIRHVMIPHIVPMMITLTILALGSIFRADFGLFYQIPRNSGLLYNVTAVLDTHIFNALRSSGDISMATAAGLYQSFVGLILLSLANFIVRRIDKDSAIL